jgi:hypothetical protein
LLNFSHGINSSRYFHFTIVALHEAALCARVFAQTFLDFELVFCGFRALWRRKNELQLHVLPPLLSGFAAGETSGDITRQKQSNEEQHWQGEINELCRRLTISFRMKSLCFCVAITDSSVAALRATA